MDDMDLWSDGAVLPSAVMAVVVFAISVLFLRPMMAYVGRVVVRAVPDRPPRRLTPQDVRREATVMLDTLAAELSRTDPATLDADLYEAAGLARTQSEQALESSAMTDLVGALVLARSGLDDLRLASGKGLRRYRPCYFNPLHEPATETVRYAVGQGEVDVPACQRCAADLDAGVTELDVLPSDRDEDRPYFAENDRWAVTGYGALVDNLPGALFRYERARREGAR